MYHKTLNNLATTYFRLGHLQEAEVRFHESIQRNPDQPMTYNNLGTNLVYRSCFGLLSFISLVVVAMVEDQGPG